MQSGLDQRKNMKGETKMTRLAFESGPPLRPRLDEPEPPPAQNLKPINLGELFARVAELEARVATLEEKSK
jgi:hypothetical protein